MSQSFFNYAPNFTLPSMGGAFHLSDLNQRNRVALLFPHDVQSARNAIEQAERGKSGWSERDLMLIIVQAPDCELLTLPTASELVRIVCDERGEVFDLYGVSPRKTSFFLLGKNDFPVALRVDHLPTDAELFALIDAMPMRQQEMQEQ